MHKFHTTIMLTINLHPKNLLEFLTLSNTIIMFLALLSLICLLIIITKKASCKIYLINFACYKPPNSLQCSKELSMKLARQSGYFSEDLLDFMKKIYERNGIGDSAYVTEKCFGLIYDPSMKDARTEIETNIFSAVDMLLAKTGVRCDDIGILIVNCCIYNTMPSVCSMIVNRYKFRESIITYSLVGMGCSAGLRAIGLAKHLLQVNQNTYALIVSTESITENFYIGKDRSKILPNCMFRVGSAAILLSNRPSDHNNSKYQLLHAVHTNTSSSDRSYKCVQREEDNVGMIGITVTKDLVASAIATIKPNIAMEASRMTLYRYGNTSSSSIWYELAYVEAKGRVKKGDRVWHIAFGSGFKCSSVIWHAMKTLDANDDDNNPWMDEISGFPVTLTDCDEQMPVYSYLPSEVD
ncbi:putative very-long-chain 3-oxoacyl-CoA synthase [Helianthus annuus]|nr:putative very-long-chain 3-oxoacyl-CoA synthase [Helianthus annuus]